MVISYTFMGVIHVSIMKKTLMCFIVLVMLLSSTAIAYAASTDDLEEGIVLVVEDSDYDPYCSTGFVVGEDDDGYYIMTTVLVTEYEPDQLIIWRDEDDYVKADFVYQYDYNDDYDEGFGVVLVKTRNKSLNLKPLILNNKHFNEKEIFTIGFPGDKMFDEEDAHTSDLDKEQIDIDDDDLMHGVDIYFLEDDLEERYTGSPAFDENNKVIGYIWAEGYEDGIVEMSQILSLLNDEGVPYKTSTTNVLLIVGIIVIVGLVFMGILVVVVIMVKKNNTLTLYGINGVHKGGDLKLNKQAIAFGRDPKKSNLVFPTKMDIISRKHCEISYDVRSKKYILIDYSSRGTFMNNGQRLQSNKPYTLYKGFKFYLVDSSQSFEIR